MVGRRLTMPQNSHPQWSSLGEECNVVLLCVSV
jgi:hypothetical protein